MRPQTIVERLDFVAKRIPGLKFTPPTQLKPGDDQGYGCFMSCDMYYIEIKVDQSHQTVKDVVISHANNDGISCPVLRKVLADQDFETFAKHLSGLHSIYQITTNDKKVKQRAYPALSALETDLTILYDYQRRRTNNCYDLIHKSPIGIMEPRKGGLPVRLTFFTTPYDLIDLDNKDFINMNLNNIIDKNLGLSATVEIEGSGQHKLQVRSLISTQQNSSLPAYAPFNSQNSEKLPAQFVLKLCQPLPMLNTSINQIIHEMNEPITIKEYLGALAANSKESLVSLIARQELDLNKGPFCRSIDLLKCSDTDYRDAKKHVYSIKLPDQQHTYHILDDYLERQDGVYITKIPFTHPTSIPNIMRVLRQQALLNFVIGSCIRRVKNISNKNISNFNEDDIEKYLDDTNIFDVIPVNLTNISVSFEHPSRESLATLEIDIKELGCQLYALDRECVCTNDFATKVFQRCWSIPVTLRSVLKKCNERRLSLLEDANKRREKELQELLASTTSQQSTQYKPHLNLQEQVLQSKFQHLNDKSNRDLNSIAEFLTSKVTNHASTSDASNQNKVDSEEANRSNLLKKYSCKPKAKQNATARNQTGNKILSLMLKRQNSSASSMEDTSSKAPLVKKAKTKSSTGESSAKNSNTPLTAKLISPEVANASRTSNKMNKQASSSGGQNVSLSLIRSPSKSQPGSASNGSNHLNKPRKSSIGAVLDSLVGGVMPEQNQFAIKQGSLGGLKLTVTKTKPATTPSSSGPATTSSTIPSNTTATTSITAPTMTTITSSSALATNKSLGLGSSTTPKYTIPKIPKTQQASQSNQTKNSVSSSTHPQNRTTSNPLALASRPSSTSSNENRKRSINQNILATNQMQQPTNQVPMFPLTIPQQPAPFATTTPNINILAPNPVAPLLPRSFMSSSVDANIISSSRPQFSTNTGHQPMPIVPLPNTLHLNVSDSLQRPSTSVINGPPQFYLQQPMFEDPSPIPTNTTNTVSSTPTVTPEISQGVSSSSDPGVVISTPSSPTECSQIDTVAPPPLIPIDSLEEPQAVSPDNDHPDDASDRLSIVDTNSNAGTPKPSSQDSPSGAPSSSSQVTEFKSEIPASEPATSEVNNDAPHTSSPSENHLEQSSEIPAITSEEIHAPSSGPTQSSSSDTLPLGEDPITSQSTITATAGDTA